MIIERMLLTNVFGTAGYLVETAVNGEDAFSKLETEEYDLVVSDVNLPKVNGFRFTEKIRNDNRFANLPVILLTNHESHEGRIRSKDVGANIYVVQKGLEQSSLLKLIKRLI